MRAKNAKRSRVAKVGDHVLGQGGPFHGGGKKKQRQAREEGICCDVSEGKICDFQALTGGGFHGLEGHGHKGNLERGTHFSLFGRC